MRDPDCRGTEPDVLNARRNLQLRVCRRGNEDGEGHEDADSQGEPDEARQQQGPLHVPRTALLLLLERWQVDSLLQSGQAFPMDQSPPLVAERLSIGRVGNKCNYDGGDFDVWRDSHLSSRRFILVTPPHGCNPKQRSFACFAATSAAAREY